MPTPETNGPAITIEISPGELLDKISILQIKSERITDTGKLANVRYELNLLQGIVPDRIAGNAGLTKLMGELKSINEKLWDIEDEIRGCESRKDFGETFVQLARNVYLTNDRRAEIKREINALCGSTIVEEKSYTQY
jgi:hypothetical protein